MDRDREEGTEKETETKTGREGQRETEAETGREDRDRQTGTERDREGQSETETEKDRVANLDPVWVRIIRPRRKRLSTYFHVFSFSPFFLSNFFFTVYKIRRKKPTVKRYVLIG